VATQPSSDDALSSSGAAGGVLARSNSRDEDMVTGQNVGLLEKWGKNIFP
jgi:hypothetical protein